MEPPPLDEIESADKSHEEALFLVPPIALETVEEDLGAFDVVPPPNNRSEELHFELNESISASNDSLTAIVGQQEEQVKNFDDEDTRSERNDSDISPPDGELVNESTQIDTNSQNSFSLSTSLSIHEVNTDTSEALSSSGLSAPESAIAIDDIPPSNESVLVSDISNTCTEFVKTTHETRFAKSNLIRIGERVTEISKAIEIMWTNGILKQNHIFQQCEPRLKKFKEVVIKALALISKSYTGHDLLKRILVAKPDGDRLSKIDAEFLKAAQSIAAIVVEDSVISLSIHNHFQRAFQSNPAPEDTLGLITDVLYKHGGLDAVLADNEKLTSAAAVCGFETEDDRVIFKTELERNLTGLRLQVEALESSLGASPHSIISQQYLRLIWKRSFTTERAEFDSFAAHLARFLDVEEGVSSSVLLNPTNRDVLKQLLCSDGNIVMTTSIANVFAPPSTGRVNELLEAVFKRGQAALLAMQLRFIPPVPSVFLGRDEMVAIVSKSILNYSVVWLHGEAGVGKSAVAAAVASKALDLDEFKSVFHVEATGVPHADAVPFSVLERVNPTSFRDDIGALATWVASLNHRCLVVIDNLGNDASTSLTLDWLRDSLIANKNSMLSLLITSRMPVPSLPAKIFSTSIEPLPLPIASQLLLSFRPQEALEQAQNIIRPGIPETIVRYAEGIRLSQRSNQDWEALRVFTAPFHEDAALAVLGAHAIHNEPPTSSTRAKLRQLVADGIVRRDGQFLRLTSGAFSQSLDYPAGALLRYQLYYVQRLGRSVSLYNAGQAASSLSLIDSARPHLNRILFDLELSPQVLPFYFDALLQGWGLLRIRWSEAQLTKFYGRVATAVQADTVLPLAAHVLILAWATAITDPDRAFAIFSAAAFQADDRRAQLTQAFIWVRKGTKDLERGVYQDALYAFEKALSFRLLFLGENHRVIALSYYTVGSVHEHLGDKERALECYQKSLSIKQIILNPNNPELASSYGSVGNICMMMGNPATAIEYYLKCLAVQQKVYGEYHCDTAVTYLNLGNAYKEMQHYQSAVENLEQALLIRQTVMGQNHPDTIVSYRHLADTYMAMNEPMSALQYYQTELAISDIAYGAQRHEARELHYHVALLSQRVGDDVRAREHIAKALAIAVKTLGSAHAQTKELEAILARMPKPKTKFMTFSKRKD